MDGWIKVHRKMLDNPIVCKDGDHVAIWVYLLLHATHKDITAWFNGKKITLLPGQLVTGRNKIVADLSINRSKVERVLKCFESEQQIEQQTTPRGRLITVKNWQSYQMDEQQSEQQVSNKRATSEQQVSTIQEGKNKRTKNRDISPLTPLTDSDLPDEVKGKLREWITYKQSQHKDRYSEVGLKSLVSQTGKYVSSHGVAAVLDVIDLSMANGWKGIIFDRIKKVEDVSDEWERAHQPMTEEERRLYASLI